MVCYDFTRYFDVGVMGIVTGMNFKIVSFHITFMASRNAVRYLYIT